MGYDCVE